MSKLGYIIVILNLAVFSLHLRSSETCGRTAMINYQEILVDHDSTKKGEGLRFHLKKDPVAEHYLNIYQEGTKVNWANAAVGTVGSLTFLVGLVSNKSNNSKKTMMIGGISLIIVNFLMAKTLEHKNEENLTRAIEEYNRRNPSKIEFDPTGNKNDNNKNPAFILNLTKEF
jgi:hypothetical protein